MRVLAVLGAIALCLESVAGINLKYAELDNSKKVPNPDLYESRDWYKIDARSYTAAFTLPINEEYMALGIGGNAPRGSPLKLVRMKGGNVLEEVAEVMMVQATTFTGIMLDANTIMTCFEDRDNHRGPLELGCSIVDLDLTANPATMTLRTYKAKFLRQGDAFGNLRYNVVSDNYQSGNSKLSLMAPNKVLFCWMTTKNWGPGPDGWTKCTVLTINGNEITPSTPYTFGGPNSPGDWEASTYMEHVKVTATTALLCRTPGVKGWMADRSLNGGSRWNYNQKECGIVTLSDDSSTVTGYTPSFTGPGGRTGDLIDLGMGKYILCDARKVDNNNWSAYHCRLMGVAAGACGGAVVTEVSDVQVFGSESEMPSKNNIGNPKTGQVARRGAITLFQKMDNTQPGIVIACAWNNGGFCRTVMTNGSTFQLGDIFFFGDYQYYDSMLQRMGDKVFGVVNWANRGIWVRVLDFTGATTGAGMAAGGGAFNPGASGGGLVQSKTLSFTSRTPGNWLKVANRGHWLNWSMPWDDTHMLLSSADDNQNGEVSSIDLIKLGANGNLEIVASAPLSKATMAQTTGIKYDDNHIFVCHVDRSNSHGQQPISCYLIEVNVAAGTMTVKINQDKMIRWNHDGDLRYNMIGSGWITNGPMMNQMAPNKIMLCYLTTDNWGPGPQAPPKKGAWTRCRILSVDGNTITASSYYQFGGTGDDNKGDWAASSDFEIIKLSSTEALMCRKSGTKDFYPNAAGKSGWDWETTRCGIITTNADSSMVTGYEEKVEYDEAVDGAKHARHLRLVELGMNNFMVCRALHIANIAYAAFRCRLLTVTCGADRTISSPIDQITVFGDLTEDKEQHPWNGNWAPSVQLTVYQTMTATTPAVVIACSNEVNAGAYCRSISTNGQSFTKGPYWQASGTNTPMKPKWRWDNCWPAHECNQQGLMTVMPNNELAFFVNRANYGLYGRRVTYTTNVVTGPPPTPNPTPLPTPPPTRPPTKNPTPLPTPLPTPPPTKNPTPMPTPPPTQNPTPAPTDPCACTGDNSLIPAGQKKYSGTNYGVSCDSAWDMAYRYCAQKNWSRKAEDDNRDCWCPKPWCYVKPECEHAMESSLFPRAGLFYSYQSCGNDGNQCFAEGGAVEKSGIFTEEEEYILGIIPQHNFFFNTRTDMNTVDSVVTTVASYPYCAVTSCSTVWTSGGRTHYGTDDESGDTCYTYIKGGKWRVVVNPRQTLGGSYERNAVVSCYLYADNVPEDEMREYSNPNRRRMMEIEAPNPYELESKKDRDLQKELEELKQRFVALEEELRRQA